MKEGWEYKKLEEICSKGSSNISLNKIEDNVGDYNLYGASGFVKGIDFYHQDKAYIGIVKDGSGVGRVDIYPPKSSLVGTMQYIFPKEDCEIGFLKYLLQGLHLESFKTGAAIPHIYFKDYGKTKVPFPPLSEQLHIVEELDLLSSIIEKKKVQLNELDNLAQSLFYEMFGDPITNDKGWEIKKIGEIASFFNGKAHENAIDDEGKYIVVNAKYISSNGEIIKNTNVQLSPLYTNDIVMVMSDVPNGKALARCSLIKSDNLYSLNQRICAFRDYKQNPIYLLFVLNRNSYYLRFDDGNGQTNLRKNEVINCPVPLPPISLQHQFASKIEAIEHQKELIKQSIKEVETLFNSRMDYYFN